MKKLINILGIGCLSFLSLFFLHQKLLPWWLLLKADQEPALVSVKDEENIEKVKQILLKPLKPLGYGSQCFAFTTDDDEYVVKLCRASRYRCWKSSKGKEKKERDFLSYYLAFHSLPEQSQVVFIHLNKTENLKTTLKVVDPLGFSHLLNADDLAFYIQKKAIELPEYLKNLSASESRVVARQLLDLFKSCCEEGLQILDIYPKNIGMYNQLPLWIDPGRIKRKDSLVEKEAQKKALYHFKYLLTPFLEPNFAALLEEELDSFF